MDSLRGQIRKGFMDKTVADAEELSDLPDGLAISPQLPYAVEVDLDRSSSGSQSFGFANPTVLAWTSLVVSLTSFELGLHSSAMITRLTLLVGTLIISLAILLDKSFLSSSSNHLAVLGHYLNYAALISAALQCTKIWRSQL